MVFNVSIHSIKVSVHLLVIFPNFVIAMSTEINIKNKKAKYEFEFIDTYIAGIVLTGTEIKSIRNGKASIMESYGVLNKGEVVIRNQTFKVQLTTPCFVKHGEIVFKYKS